MIQLRPHQEEVFSLMRQHSRMLTVAPTSAGKSIMMISDAKHRFTEGESAKTILVVAPKILLAQQLSEEMNLKSSSVMFPSPMCIVVTRIISVPLIFLNFLTGVRSIRVTN
jgi:superfamily II DNA helicase RecQ